MFLLPTWISVWAFLFEGMTSSLAKKLQSVYTQENLHKITSKIIALYKNKQYDSLREIHKLVFVENTSNSDPASNLNRNDIGYIDGLSFLTHLRILDISLNNIDDIIPLFDLKELEYVNVVGNEIPQKQIQTLKKKGIVVIH
jgi:Leucine-rich repeat (LRR) protein